MTPRDRKYGAKGNGHDDGGALQAWLDDGGGELDREYLSGRQLQYGANCRIDGVHKSLSVIGAHPSFGGGEFFLNREQEREQSPVTRGVRFSRMGICGSPALRENGVALSLIGVADSLFADIALSGFKFLVTPANCTKLVFDHLDGYDGGCMVQPGDTGNINCEGGTAFLGHSQWPNTYFDLLHCHFHDLTWTAIDTSIDGGAHHWRIVSVRIARVMEAGLFGRLTDSCVTDPVISDVVRRAVSGAGFEGGMVRSEWLGGTISRTDSNSIILLGPREGSVVRGVGVFDPHRHGAGNDSAIGVRSTADGITIEECYGSDHWGSGAAPIGFYADQPMNNVTVRGRHFWQWAPGNIVREVGDCRGTNFVIQD